MATTSWTGGGAAGDWSDGNNWSGAAPANGDTINIAATGDDIATNLPGVPLTGGDHLLGSGWEPGLRGCWWLMGVGG